MVKGLFIHSLQKHIEKSKTYSNKMYQSSETGEYLDQAVFLFYFLP